MIDTSLPGTRKLPQWLTERVSADVASRIAIHWHDQRWSEVVRDTPQETWLALALHPNSIMRGYCGDGFHPREVSPPVALFVHTYSCSAKDLTHTGAREARADLYMVEADTFEEALQEMRRVQPLYFPWVTPLLTRNR